MKRILDCTVIKYASTCFRVISERMAIFDSLKFL
jgi:hypothetical protein